MDGRVCARPPYNGQHIPGRNAYGHPEFDTQRSPLGDLVHRLKNRGDRETIEPIVETVVGFLKTWRPRAEAIVPVPPSNVSRRAQPVIELAAALSEQTGIPICRGCVSKVTSTAQLKDVFEQAKRTEILAGAFAVDRNQTEGKRLLLFDDLFRSGATAGALTRLLLKRGGAAITQTRRKL